MPRKGPTYAHGKICYLEIPTTDVARSISFYEKIFGWKARTRGCRTHISETPMAMCSGSTSSASAEVGT